MTERTLRHTRHTLCQGFELDNGLWEIEGRMTDLKSFAMQNSDRRIPVGEPLHDLSLALTLDSTLLIHAVRVEMNATPFRSCNRITEAFQQLKGLRLLPGFTRQVRELLGGVAGCTHLVELLTPIATTAYQTLWQSESGYNGDDPAVTGFLINSCHALAEEGEVVQQMVGAIALPEALAKRLAQP